MDLKDELDKIFSEMGKINGEFVVRLVKKKISKAYLIHLRNQLNRISSLVDDLKNKL